MNEAKIKIIVESEGAEELQQLIDMLRQARDLMKEIAELRPAVIPPQ